MPVAPLVSPVGPDAQGSTSRPRTVRLIETQVTLQRRMQQSLFAYHSGDYTVALKGFERAGETASSCGAYAEFVEACTYILRILAEREEFTKLERIESNVLAILNSANLSIQLKSRAMYVLGICSCYQGHTQNKRYEQAMSRFRQAIDFAMLGEDKEALAAPLYGSATVLYAQHRYSESLKELERLDVLLSCLRLPDLTSASFLLRAMILRNQQRPDEALRAAWAAFDSLKHNPNLVLYLHSLSTLGTVLIQKGDTTSASLYLDLANRTLKRDQFPRIARLIDEAIVTLGGAAVSEFDLKFDTRTGVLLEKSKGEIRFEGQFILRDLLRAFLESPGRVFTKQDLAEEVWKENYDSGIHDNKIYVTIKRLRKMLENQVDKSDYILRAKNGYFLNPNTRVAIDDQLVKPKLRTLECTTTDTEVK